jgi:hypothetical protein
MIALLASTRCCNIPDLSGAIITAIPHGLKWGVKIVSPSGSVNLPDIFHSRLEALGGAAMIAGRCNARVLP